MDGDTESSGKSVGRIENLTPWVKGQSGNPAGLPKGTRHRSTIIREWLDCRATDGNEGTKTDQIVRAQILKAEAGDLNSFNAIMDSAFGKIPDVQEHTGLGGGPILAREASSENLSDEQLIQELEDRGLPTTLLDE